MLHGCTGAYVMQDDNMDKGRSPDACSPSHVPHQQGQKAQQAYQDPEEEHQKTAGGHVREHQSSQNVHSTVSPARKASVE